MRQIEDAYKKLPLGNICDANGKYGSMDMGIKPIDVTCKIAGPAYTVKGHPGDNVAIHKAILEAPAGSVLVVDVAGYCKGGHFGEIMAFACMQRKIIGLVIDGTVRDANDIQGMGFPVFCRGLCPNGTHKDVIGSTHCTIICGGVAVSDGDMVIGDRDGVVVVAKDRIEQVLQDAKAIATKEVHVLEMLSEGKTTAEIYKFDKIWPTTKQL